MLKFFKDLFTKINSFFKNNFMTILMALIIVLICITSIQSCRINSLSQTAKQGGANQKALTDTVRYYYVDGQKESMKYAYLADIKDLKDLNRDLYDEVKKEKKEREIMAISLAKIQYTLENVKANSDTIIVHNDSFYTSKFAFIDSGTNWKYNIKGKTDIFTNKGKISSSSTLENLSIEDRVIFGWRQKKDGIEVFARSSFTGAEIPSVEGSFIKWKELNKYEKKKRFGIGPYFGIGYGVNPVTGKFSPQVGFGVGINYSVFQW